MKATLGNLKMKETRYGISWTAEIKATVNNKVIIIPVVNDGKGGVSKICDFTSEQREAVTTLREWANKQLPNDFTPLESIVEFTDENESLQTGLNRLRGI